MSASTKKKLRNQQDAAKMTERQLAEQAEAKKLKLYTAAFVVVMALLLVTAVTVGVTQTISNSGVREKNTVAMTVGEHEISNAELTYFYIDTVNNFYSQNGSYATLFGLDLTAPLDEQIMDEATGETWADYMLSSAKNSVASVYAMSDAAAAAGFEAPESVLADVETTVTNMSMYATIYGYGDVDTYLKAMYGMGASEEGYREYLLRSMTADAYYTAYGESLVYEDADLRAAEAENYHAYSSFTYNYYYLSTSKFLEGGTQNEDGTTTYSDAEKAASVAAAEEAAKALTSEEITSVEELDAAIAALSINEGSTTASSTLYEDNLYSYTPAVAADWMDDEGRKEGDLAYLKSASTAADGTETVNGYYIVYFHSINDNNTPLKNVRHILVNFQGGTTDANGTTTYSDEEKAAAKAEAEQILADFKAGAATEESFAAMVPEYSADPGSIENGGLYEDIYPGQMVAGFEGWCFDESRKAGDTGIVETEYGYHVMYFVSDSETTYRDMQIRNALSQADLAEWYNALSTSLTIVDGDYKYIPTDMVLSQ